MRRALGACGLAAVVWVAAGASATRTYSTGSIRLAIPDGGTVERAIRVGEAGPVSYLSVGLRIAHPDDGQLTVELQSPSGRRVTLAERRGAGGHGFGTGPGCEGQLAYFDDNRYDPPIGRGSAPFDEGPYQPEQPLRSLYGTEAAGTWLLRVTDGAPGRTGALRCAELEISRDVVEATTVRKGRVAAELSWRETNGSYDRLRLRIARGGKPRLDAPLERVNCRGCPSSGPSLLMEPRRAVSVRDLDADGEPEVLLDLYTGGAHCCFYTLVFRYRPKLADYGHVTAYWGDPGYRIADLDHDGRVELVTADDRFAYTFASYAASVLPLRIWRYDRGRLVDLTDRFPGLVAREADELWRSYLENRGGDNDVRGILASYMADAYRLGREDEGWARLENALRRGDLHPYGNDDLWPADAAYLRKLRLFLQRSGYAP